MESISTISKYIFSKAYIQIGFFACFYCFCSSLFAQDQKLSDSLEIVYSSGDYNKENELKLLQELAESETNADKILTYALLLITKAKEAGSSDNEFLGYLRQGDAYRLKSELTKALESYLIASKVASDYNLKSRGASINIAIADVYSIMGDSPTAVKYYSDALKLINIETDPLSLASAQLNLGDEYFNQNKLDSALYYFNESIKIFEKENYPIGVAYNLGNIGLINAEMGKYIQAEEKLGSAIEVLERLEDYYPICVYLNAMSDIYAVKNEKEKSLRYAELSLELAEKYELKEQISDSNLKLSKYYEKHEGSNKALEYYKNYVAFRDQVSSIKEVQKMANVRTEFEVSQKQIEVNLLNQQKKIQRYIAIGIGIALFLSGLLAISLFRSNKFMKKTNEIIAYEKKRSDDLLKNILPEETAKELKENGVVKAKQFEQVSVLFTDFKGFTKSSENLDPELLVESINYYFSKFDEITDKYGLEKIKTIGDAYMCAGGLPFAIDDQAVKTCQAAIDIVEFVRKTKRSINHNLAKFDIRVGINTGPIVAGVVGTKKFQYDIWGDTVNIASRMESSGDVGKVNISESTYDIIKKYDVFKFIYRGEIDTKGKGKMAMYFIEYKD